MTLYVIWSYLHTSRDIKIFGITDSKDKAEQFVEFREQERREFRDKMKEWAANNPPPYEEDAYREWIQVRLVYSDSLHPDAHGTFSPPSIQVTETGVFDPLEEQVVK